MKKNYIITHRPLRGHLPSEGLYLPTALVVFAFVGVVILLL